MLKAWICRQIQENINLYQNYKLHSLAISVKINNFSVRNSVPVILFDFKDDSLLKAEFEGLAVKAFSFLVKSGWTKVRAQPKTILYKPGHYAQLS